MYCCGMKKVTIKLNDDIGAVETAEALRKIADRIEQGEWWGVTVHMAPPYPKTVEWVVEE